MHKPGNLFNVWKKKFLKKYVFDAREGLVETLSPAEKTKLTDFIARTEDLAESLVPVIQGIYSIPGTTLKFKTYSDIFSLVSDSNSDSDSET